MSAQTSARWQREGAIARNTVPERPVSLKAMAQTLCRRARRSQAGHNAIARSECLRRDGANYLI